jgi:transposase
VEAKRWFVGIDWATEKHQICVLNLAGDVVNEWVVPHTGEGIAGLCTELLDLSGSQVEGVHVAIEVPHGAVVEMLLEQGFSVSAVNPKQLDRFRDRFTVAGAKDDRRDAQVLADSLRTDPHCFRRLEVDAPEVIELREWSRMTEDLQQERVRLSNRVREQLRRYYPQMLQLNEDVAADWFLDLWEKAPTPRQAARLRESTIQRILKQRRIRRLEAKSVLERLREKPLTVSPGTIAAATAHIATVAARLRLINQQLKQAHKRLDELSALPSGEDDDSGQESKQRDAQILRSMPGIGRIVLATLLAEASQPLKLRDYHGLRALSGVAPITRQSGKKCVVVMRRACHLRLRNAVYHWARTCIQHHPASRAQYAALRARGHSHGRALRSVGDRLLAVACAILRNQTPFDPTRYTATREDRA